jgi:PEP-CTERM motif
MLTRRGLWPRMNGVNAAYIFTRGIALFARNIWLIFLAPILLNHRNGATAAFTTIVPLFYDLKLRTDAALEMHMTKKITVLAIILGVIAFSVGGLIVGPANAGIIQVTSRAAVGSDLTVNWGVFGPAGTGLSCYCSEPVGPIVVDINGSSGELNRFDEGSDYTGNFAIGDQLLSQPYESDEMTVGFSVPILGFGTQIQPLDYTGAFTGYVHVLTDDGMDQTFSVLGDSTTAEDNSAPFIGVTSTVADIIGMQFYVDIGNVSFPADGALAINQLNVDVPNTVPEPVTLSLFGAGLAGAAAIRRRKKAQKM